MVEEFGSHEKPRWRTAAAGRKKKKKKEGDSEAEPCDRLVGSECDWSYLVD